MYKIKGSDPISNDFSRCVEHVVGRMYNASPREIERYYLRTVLLHGPTMTSFSDVLNLKDTEYSFLEKLALE